MKKLFYALMLVFVAVLGGCRGEHSLGKDIYVYVFTQDFDAERIGGEFEMTGFSKGTYVPQNDMFTGDSVVVTRQFGKEFVPYRVPLSVPVCRHRFARRRAQVCRAGSTGVLPGWHR